MTQGLTPRLDAGLMTDAKIDTEFDTRLALKTTDDLTEGTTNLYFSGAGYGFGIIPLGGILATASNLSGAYNCSATTAADAYGFVVCGGQTISDATSPMNGVVIPNLNDSAFIMGHATAGTAGGANSTTLSSTQLPAHTHTLSHTHTLTTSSITDGGLGTHTHTLPNNSYYAGAAGEIPANVAPAHGFAIVLFPTGAPSSIAHTHSGTTSDASATTTSTTGSGSAYDSRPKYITAEFIIRIK